MYNDKGQNYISTTMFHEHFQKKLSLVMRKPAFCICENKDADQLRGNLEADERLCFRYTYSTILLLPKSEISSLQPYSVVTQPGLCRTWSEAPKTGFLTTRLISHWVIPLALAALLTDRASQIPGHTCEYLMLAVYWTQQLVARLVFDSRVRHILSLAVSYW